jgi:hypothetical protein
MKEQTIASCMAPCPAQGPALLWCHSDMCCFPLAPLPRPMHSPATGHLLQCPPSGLRGPKPGRWCGGALPPKHLLRRWPPGGWLGERFGELDLHCMRCWITGHRHVHGLINYVFLIPSSGPIAWLHATCWTPTMHRELLKHAPPRHTTVRAHHRPLMNTDV